MSDRSLRQAAGVALVSALLGLAATAAQAATCVGSCGVLGADGDVTAPPGGSTYGWVSTFGGIDGQGQLPGIGGTDGSVFTTNTFAANAGDVLKYDFNYVSSDGQSEPGSFIFEDYAWVQLVNLGTGATTMLFNARSEPTGLQAPGQGLPAIDPGVTLTPASSAVHLGGGVDGTMAGGPAWTPLGDYSGWCWGPGCGYTGWINSTFTVADAGSYRLKFGVTNWGDNIYDSGLAYAGITIGDTPVDDGEGGFDDGVVPEPSTWALMILGFGGAGAVFRRRRSLAAGARNA